MNLSNLDLLAPAKINLHLSVVGRRPDGYHLLETLMVKLDLADRLKLEKSEAGINLEVFGADLPADRNNLVFRAAEAFYRETGLKPGVSLKLEKKIPTAAGLGGGSSDCARTLAGLNRLYGRPLDEVRLTELGLSLGADVPFFLYPGLCAWARGVGEILTPAPFPGKYWILLVNPGKPLSTAEVFKNYKLELTKRRRNTTVCRLYESSFTIDRDLINDLEKVVSPRFPEVFAIKKRLAELGALGSMMSGSGPTVFGLFDRRDQRELALEKLRAEAGNHWIILGAVWAPQGEAGERYGIWTSEDEPPSLELK